MITNDTSTQRVLNASPGFLQSCLSVSIFFLEMQGSAAHLHNMTEKLANN